jgi:DNA-binding transcriptional regulator PaaX
MLKTLGIWEKLSDKERLVMLGLSLELHQIGPKALKHIEVMMNSGLSENDFRSAVHSLEAKGLLTVENPGNVHFYWIELAGEAADSCLLPLSRTHR